MMFHRITQTKHRLNEVALFAILLFASSCTQVPPKPLLPADQRAVSKGMDIIKDSEITDKSSALEAFKVACDLGNRYGCHQVGMAHTNGLYGAEKNMAIAGRWFLKAANRGYFPSQQNMANLHALKLIDPVNDVEGYKWIILASRGASRCTPDTAGTEGFNGPKDARRVCQLALQGQSRIRGILRNRLTAEQRQQAELLADGWTAE